MGPGARLPRMSVGGAQMAETLASWFRQRFGASSTAAPVGVVGKVGRVRLGLVVNTLLGPEGTSVALLRWGFACLLRAFLTLMRNCWAVPGVACGGVLGLVVV
jgi:hypothetical protein